MSSPSSLMFILTHLCTMFKGLIINNQQQPYYIRKHFKALIRNHYDPLLFLHIAERSFARGSRKGLTISIEQTQIL